MLYYYLLYFFIACVAKLILAMLMIYMLLPSDNRCSGCDQETLLLRPHGIGKIWIALFIGRVQRRWCPSCRWEGLARTVGFRPPPARSSARGTPTFKR